MSDSEPTPKIGRIRDSVASLESFSEGDWVEYSEGNYGVVVGKLSGGLEWPTGEEETEKVEVDEDENVYVVARASGGSKPFTADDLNGAERSDVIDTDDVPDEPEEDIDDAAMSRAYYVADAPYTAEELMNARAELVSVPGVDDPGVGWDSYPDSWEDADVPARLILLDAWTSMEASFTGCVAEIGSKRVCASMKDQVLGTTRWRGKF